MLDDLTKEIKAQLYERVKSPLFGAFALSWVVWNYRALLAVLSGMTFQEKLDYFDTLHPSVWHWLEYCLAAPLVTAVAFLLLYPHPARWMYRYWANQHKELKKVQQEIEDETPMTQEEAKALRKTSLAQAMEAQAQLRDMSQTNRELNERLKALTEGNLRLASERDQFEKAAKALEEQLVSPRAAILAGGTGGGETQPSGGAGVGTIEAIIDALPDGLMEELASFVGQDSRALNVFIALVSLGGTGEVDKISALLNANPIDVKHGLEVLKQRDYTNATGGPWRLTPAGRSVAVNLNLTALVPRNFGVGS